ncbi:MAG: hypothetical protein CME60_09805 [Halobacteriovoraceae bacterium]|nr:hypothetical protein [Halobacteriovoraceae bacterium]
MKLKLITASLLILSPAAFAKGTINSEYKFIKSVNLNKLPVKEKIKYHKLFTETITSLAKSEKYPKHILKRKISQNSYYHLISNLLFDSSIASSASNVCLFGGWPSHRSGTCQVPFQSSGVAVANQIGINAYDSDDYCGSSNLFRCNPDIFGPGLEATPEITEKFGNINGNKNNSSPFSAGICVDVSRGYNSLTKDCAEASKALDEYRDKPWREEYFAKDDNADFQKMQSTISSICKERSERRENDPMCDKLEESLGLTFAAVSAGAIADVNVEDLFPGCGGVVPDALPTCSSEDHASLKNLREALSEIQSDQSCRFKSVSAEIAPKRPERQHGRSTIYGDAPEPVIPESSSQCKTFLAQGIQAGMEGETNINIFFKGTAVDDLEYLSVEITPEMTKEEIIAKIKSGDNADAFANTCAVSTCPSSDAPGTAALYDVMKHLRSNEQCHFKNIQVIDQATNFDRNFEKSQCQQSVEGALAVEGLGEENQEIMFLVTDATGTLNTGALIVQANQESTKDDILEQFEQGDNKGVYEGACQRTRRDFYTNASLARTELGISEDQYIDPSQEQLLVKLANLKRRNENVEVSIDANGDITAKPRVAVINENPGMQFITNADGSITFPASFDAQIAHFNSRQDEPMPEDINKLITDMAGDLRLNNLAENGGTYSFEVTNAGANLLGNEQDIVDGHFIQAKQNENGNYTYTVSKASHEDQIMVKRAQDEERARYIASNTEERRVCVEKNARSRCTKWETRQMYCAEKGFLGFGCSKWEEVE